MDEDEDEDEEVTGPCRVGRNKSYKTSELDNTPSRNYASIITENKQTIHRRE